MLLKSSAKIVLIVTQFLAKRALYMPFEAGQAKTKKEVKDFFNCFGICNFNALITCF